MYRVVEVIDYALTRDVVLKNTETGTIDICFDDSLLASNINFGFLEEGKQYDCKIALLGNIMENVQKGTILCTIVGKTVIGMREYFKVLVEEDIYYIRSKNISTDASTKQFLFQSFRKDLIEVNGILHFDITRGAL